jgi:hypothetical protein
MKSTIEKFMRMETPEVLDRFYSLPGATAGDNFVYIPGNRDSRVLLVAHADTVFDGPPWGIEWDGNVARSTRKSSYVSGSGYSGPKKEEPKQKKKKGKGHAGGDDSPIEVVPTLENVDPATQKLLDENIKLVQGGKEYSWTEMQKRNAQNGNSGGSRVGFGKGSYSGSSYGYYRGRGLGADDRVGAAMMWLMRRTGHSLLITDLEERGGVGAKEASRKIKEVLSEHQFAIEVDRGGDQQFVHYGNYTQEFVQYILSLTGKHWQVGYGSYSDIADVCRAAGICGANLAAGYFGAHSENETFYYDAWLRTFKVVQRICNGNIEHPRFALPAREEKDWGNWNWGDDWRTKRRYTGGTTSAPAATTQRPTQAEYEAMFEAYMEAESGEGDDTARQYAGTAESSEVDLMNLHQQVVTGMDRPQQPGTALAVVASG